MRVVLYARVSTTRQAEKDLSIPAQLTQMRAYCHLNNHEIIKEYQEPGKTGRDENRPAFQKMMKELCGGDLRVEGLLVLTTSRFFRDSFSAKKHKRELRNQGIRVVAISQETSDDASGYLTEHIYEGFDELYSLQLGTQTAAGMQENARKGYFNGSRPPFGYEAVSSKDERGNTKSKLAINKAEAEVVKILFNLYVEGIEGRPVGLRGLAQYLNEHGMLYRNGTKWRKDLLERLLENPIYIGEAIYNRWSKRVPGQKIKLKPRDQWIVIKVEPIVSKELFDAAHRNRVNLHPCRNHGRHSSSPMLLAQLARCGTCGAVMTLATGKGYRYYLCSQKARGTKKACPGNRIPEGKLDALVLNHLSERVLESINFRELVKGFLRSRRKSESGLRTKMEDLNAKIEEVKARKAKIFAAIEEGGIEYDLLGPRLRELQTEEDTLERQKENLWPGSNPEVPPYLFKKDSLTHAREVVLLSLRDGKAPVARKMLRTLVDEVRVCDKTVQIKGKKAALVGLALGQKKEACDNHFEKVIARGSSWLREQVAKRTVRTVTFNFPIFFSREGKSLSLLEPKGIEKSTETNDLKQVVQISRQQQFTEFMQQNPHFRRADVAREFGVSRAFVTKVLRGKGAKEICEGQGPE